MADKEEQDRTKNQSNATWSFHEHSEYWLATACCHMMEKYDSFSLGGQIFP